MWTFHLRWRRSVSLLALLSLPCVRHPDKSNPLNKQLGLRYSGIVEDKAGLSSLDRIYFLTRCKSSGFIEFSTKNNSLLRCIGTWANFIYTSAHRFFPFFKTLFPLWRLIRNIKETLGNCWALSWSLGEAHLYTLSARFSDFTVLFSRTGSLLGPLHSSSANYLKENRACNGLEMLTSIKFCIVRNSWQILCVYEPIPFGELVITSRDWFRPVFGGFRATDDSVFHLYARTIQTYLWQSCLLFTFWMGKTSVGSRFEHYIYSE